MDPNTEAGSDDAPERFEKVVRNLPPPVTVEDARRAGQDAGQNGVNERNCSFRFFATKEHAEAWSNGMKEEVWRRVELLYRGRDRG